jgi:hypothetical protein
MPKYRGVGKSGLTDADSEVALGSRGMTRSAAPVSRMVMRPVSGGKIEASSDRPSRTGLRTGVTSASQCLERSHDKSVVGQILASLQRLNVVCAPGLSRWSTLHGSPLLPMKGRRRFQDRSSF